MGFECFLICRDIFSIPIFARKMRKIPASRRTELECLLKFTFPIEYIHFGARDPNTIMHNRPT